MRTDRIVRHWIGYFLLATLLPAAASKAALRTQVIEYHDGVTVLRGYLAYDDGTQDKRPGVLIAPEWWGLTDYPKHRAEQLAQMGYIAFALDMYGNGVTAADPEGAKALVAPFYGNRKFLRSRAAAGLKVLTDQTLVDPQRIAAIGYCFGGTVALELARAGAPLVGVVAFHGDLSNPTPADDANIKGQILVCHGAKDPLVPLSAVSDFEKEMGQTAVPWQVNLYSGAMHAFTNPDADSHHMPGVAYNAEADAHSFAAMRSFFDEIFK